MVSCYDKPHNSFTEKNVIYLSEINNYKIDLRNDTVALYFLTSFKKDTISLFLNDFFITKKIISTDEVDGTALLLELGAVSNIQKIGLKFNNNKTISFICDKDNQLFIINCDSNKQLVIKAVTHFPSFR